MFTYTRQSAVLRKSHSSRIKRNRVAAAFPTSCRPGRNFLSCSNQYSLETNRDTAGRQDQNPGWKRALDITCIISSFPIVLPLMVLIVLWIRLVSTGPALYRQERIGQNGRRFTLFKFRSMKMNSGTGRHERHLRELVRSDSPMTKLDLLCDSRLIPGGCFLRAAGLDELPQLLNVLKGEMSLVGPRPCLPDEYKFFSEIQRQRFKVLPGLTGNWQVNGKNQTTFSEMNVMDVRYVRDASLGLDLSIMLRTPAALFTQMCQAFRHHHNRGVTSGFNFAVTGNEAGQAFTNQRIG